MSNPKPNIPSGGRAWPAALRRELGMADPPAQTSDDDSLCTSPLMQRTALTLNQLRQYIHRSYAAITSLQRQIYRGEESYFEDSYAHGNLFSGWDSIWIEAENGANAGEREIQATHHHKSSSLRKMPMDYRWFSMSCKLIDPKGGDGKVEAILSRGSLAEPTPKSTAAAKASSISISGEAASGRVLKRSSPLKVSSSPSTIKSTAIKTDISHEHPTTSSPPAKKTKPNNDNDEMIDIAKESTSTAVVADSALAFNTQQTIPTAPPDRVTSLSASPTAKDATREMMPTNSAAKLETMTSHGESEATATLLQSIRAPVKVTSQPETSVSIDVEMKDASAKNATIAIESPVQHQDDAADSTAVVAQPDNEIMDTVAPLSKPIEYNVSTSLQDKGIPKDDLVETKVIEPTQEKKQDHDTVEKRQAAITSLAETAASSTAIQKSNEVTSSTALETSNEHKATAGAQIVEEMEISTKDNYGDTTKQSRKDVDREENNKVVIESPSTKPDSGVAVESSKQSNLSDGKKTATADNSDSDEDITLSQIVKIKSKTSLKAQTATAHGGGQVVGTRTSSRRRKQSTHN